MNISYICIAELKLNSDLAINFSELGNEYTTKNVFFSKNFLLCKYIHPYLHMGMGMGNIYILYIYT